MAKDSDYEGTALKFVGGLFLIFAIPIVIYILHYVGMTKAWGLEPKSWPWLIGIYSGQIFIAVGFRGLAALAKVINKKG